MARLAGNLVIESFSLTVAVLQTVAFRRRSTASDFR
jgi:hypothetical protein